jgi:galactose mutarotase-like enzyme
MDRCRILRDWQYRGFQTVVLENRYLRVAILMDHGAKVFEFIYKPSDRDFLYHHPRVEPRPPVHGANADNWWSGGLDVAIPTGHPCHFRGDELPYLGEVWSLPWKWEIVAQSDARVEIHSWCHTLIAPFLVERWDALEAGERRLRQRYKITNVGWDVYPFLWGIHPGFAVTPDFRIDLPAEEVLIEESLPDNRLGQHGATYRWPHAKTREGQAVDMRRVLAPQAQVSEFHYATALRDGWVALTDTAAREGVAMVFPREIFSAVWLWLVYGGWRNTYTAAIEPWTGYPAKLCDAIEFGRHSRLPAGASLHAEIQLLVFDSVTGVSHITPASEIVGA